MNAPLLVLRGLLHRWRANLAVALGTALATSILVGALGAGDSVRESLRSTALARLGSVSLAMELPDRWVRTALAGEVAAQLGGAGAAVISLVGSASGRGGQARVSPVHVLGVSPDFGSISGSGAFPSPGADDVVLNESLARRLEAGVGEELILRVPAGSVMPADAPLSTGAGALVSVPCVVAAVLPDRGIGGFSLRVGQAQPLNAFVSRESLARLIDKVDRSNTILLAPNTPCDASRARRVLAAAWRLEDAGLDLRKGPGGPRLVSKRVLIEPWAETAAASAGGHGVLTWFVDSITSSRGGIPYSFVSGLDDDRVPGNLRSDEIVLNDWAARELSAGPGDRVTLEYRVPGPRITDGLRDERATFLVRSVVPIDAADADLMPDFPGIAGTASCRDWAPGVPIDLSRITARDQAYWDRYRGSPKAFVSLTTARRLWSTRFGSLTAVRFPSFDGSADEISRRIIAALDPESLGISFAAVREIAVTASAHGIDFGTLFLGLSMFLVAAALLLTGLLQHLFMQSRLGDMGILTAVGVGKLRVFMIVAGEGTLVALAGSILGLLGGIAAHRGIVFALTTVWRDAVPGASLDPVVTAGSFAAAFLGGFLSSALILAVSAAALLRVPPASALRLRAGSQKSRKRKPGRAGPIILVCAGAAATAASVLFLTSPTSFFSAAGSLLATGLTASFLALRSAAGRRRAAVPTILTSAISGAARRRTRSIAVAALAACGILIVTAVAANRRVAPSPEHRESGSGGFSLVAETASTIEKRSFERLAASMPVGVRLLGLRALPGDDASCLNLNRAARPRLLGVAPPALAGRFTVSSMAAGMSGSDPWTLLEADLGDGCIPAVIDQSVAEWGLGLAVGQEITYRDEQGLPLKVRLVAAIEDSVFQGSLLVSEDELARHFPSAGGSSFFLVEAPASARESTAATLRERLAARGVSVESTAARLARFNAVENAYMAIFGFLGWLGLCVGALGTGIVAARNVVESRGELSLLRALGVGRLRVSSLVVLETVIPLALGVIVGALSAVVAASPAAGSRGVSLATAAYLLPLLAIPAGSVLAAFAASWAASRASVMSSLRDE
jgi:putative ABC transport system permease protein